MKREDLKNWTWEQMELKIISLSSDKDILTKEIERMGRLIGNYESKIKELEKDNAAYSRANDLYKENIEDCEKKNGYLCNLRNELEAENKALKQRIKDLEDICDGSCFANETDDRDEKIAKMQDRIDSDCVRINRLHVTIDTLVDKYSRLRKTLRMD